MTSRVALVAAWLLAGSSWSAAALAQATDPGAATSPAGGDASSPAATPTQAKAADDDNTGASADPVDDDSEEIVVTGQVERGSVVGNVKPEQTFSPAEIRSYGVSSVQELLTELAPQTGGQGSQPVTLLNGKRISGFQEIQDIPTEAIQRVEVLPEEVALSYGYPANQKVVNIVLRPRFRAVTTEIRGGATTKGDRENGSATANVLRIQNDNRVTLNAEYTRAARLLESQRDIDPTPPGLPYSLTGNITAVPGSGFAEIDPALSAAAGVPVTVAQVPGSAASGRPTVAAFVPGANTAGVSDVGQYRTLSPATEAFRVNGVIAHPIGDVSASLNARLELTDNDTLQGLPQVGLRVNNGNPYSPFTRPVELYRYLEDAGALRQGTKGETLHVGLGLNGQFSTAWRWSFTGNYDHSVTKTSTDRGISATAIQTALDAGDTSVNPFGTLAPSLLASRLTDTGRSRSEVYGGDFLVNGSPFSMPAGKVTTSFRVGSSHNSFASRSVRSSVLALGGFSRDQFNGQANFDIPITSRREAFGEAIGDLSLNANVAFNHLSDFGTLKTFGYGLRWTPVPAVRLFATRSQNRSAPSGQQINDPTVVTPNTPVFDYLVGDTVFVNQISGGNPNLRASNSHTTRISANIKPWTTPDLTITATYTNTKNDDPISSFPTPTPQIENAFTARFIRDSNGNLVSIDARPINYDSTRQSQLRYGFNINIPLRSALEKAFQAWRESDFDPAKRPKGLPDIPLGPDGRPNFAALRNRQGGGQPGQQRQGQGGQAQGQQGAAAGQAGTTTPPADGATPAPAAGDATAQAQGLENLPGRGAGGFPGGGFPGGGRPGGPGGPGGFRGPGGGGFGGGPGGPGGGNGMGRLQFAAYHTWRFTDTILIAPGVPILDLLNGSAVGSSGGQPRHQVELQAGYSMGWIGARLSGNWQSSTRVVGALGASSTTLRFSDIATFDLRLFANLGQNRNLVRSIPFFRGTRITVSLNNLFDATQSVRDQNGDTPLRYQPDYLNPLGRTFLVSFRKQLF